MNFNLRWQLLLATVAFGLVLALLSFQSKTVGLCSIQVPAPGGTFVEGIVGRPDWINPLVSDNNPVDRELVNLLFDGLTEYDAHGRLRPALAESWLVDDDGLEVTFKLRKDVLWHDGEVFSAADVAFTYGLMQDPAFPGGESLRALWQAVTIDLAGDHEVRFTLPEPYAPFLDATTRGILPAHIWQELDPLEESGQTRSRTPIGTGPFMIIPGQDWERSGRIRLSPNPGYWTQGTQLANLEFRFYPDNVSVANAFVSGELHAVNSVSPDILPLVAAAEGARLFSTAAGKYTSLMFNLSESGSAALQSVEGRRAASYAIDRLSLIDDILAGQGLPLDGPYLPSSWAYNPAPLASHFQQPISATQMLESEGWLLAEGEHVRVRDGDSLTLRLLTSGSEDHTALARAVASQWRDVGIVVEMTQVQELAELRQALAGRDFDVALVDIAPPGDPDLYDFWSQEATVRGQGYSGWNSRRASEALEGGRKLWSIEERQPYYDTFLVHYDQELPAVTLYQHVNTYAMTGDVRQAEIGRVSEPRDRYAGFADWFLLHRDVTVECADETSS